MKKGFNCVRHDVIAQTCRNQPRAWVLVRTYNTKKVAYDTALRISEGVTYKAYRPAGSFEGRYEMSDEGWTVFARYIGGAS